jgi:UDP-N-acetyl-2-amino-2-deoxyglucuronate dehydrogenase
MKNFALIGAAGYVAPRHLQAIKETGSNLVAALDKFDSVGAMDSYFPHADFFTEFERFDRHIDKLRREGKKVDYVSICSPNYLHDSHIRFALRQGADAICEKPLVLNPWNLDALEEIESETGKKIYTILQLRLHPAIIKLRENILSSKDTNKMDVTLNYITSRGRWYHHSWKGEESKSGGIATNIGIHFFDMLLWIFGNLEGMRIDKYEHDHASGELDLSRARVKWYLSINEEHLPAQVKAQGKRTYRSLKMNGSEIEFSEGFTNLHTLSYHEILKGNGFGLKEARPSIDLVHKIRNSIRPNS